MHRMARTLSPAPDAAMILWVEIDRLARVLGNVTKKMAVFRHWWAICHRKGPKCHSLVTKKAPEIPPFLYININVTRFIDIYT